MASTLITVDIQIKPYLKKFLQFYSVNTKNDLVKFPRKHSYNRLLTELVTNYNALKSIPIADRQNVIDYFKPSNQKTSTNCVVIILPFHKYKNIRYYNYLSIDKKKEFRSEVRKDFNLEFLKFLRKGLLRGKPRIQVIENFKRKYNITEDDLKSESLYRYSSRLFEDI